LEKNQLILNNLKEAVKFLDDAGHDIGTVNQLFVRAGFTKQHASAINNSRRTPDRTSLLRLAEHYNLSLDFLLTGNPPVLLSGSTVQEAGEEYIVKSQDPCKPVMDQMTHRIDDLHKLITHLEKRIIDKDKIIALLECQK